MAFFVRSVNNLFGVYNPLEVNNSLLCYITEQL